VAMGCSPLHVGIVWLWVVPHYMSV